MGTCGSNLDQNSRYVDSNLDLDMWTITLFVSLPTALPQLLEVDIDIELYSNIST